MELFTYSYNILTDTLNGEVAVNELTKTITESDITISLDYIRVENGNVYMSFKAELSDDEEEMLLIIINNHDGVIEENSLPTKVKVIEESSDGVDKTNGKFQADSIKVSVPVETGEYSTTISYPFYIGLLSATWFCNEVNMGDEASFYISSDTVIGYVTVSQNSGVTVIYVNDTVVENVVPGYMLSIGDDDYIKISKVDTTNNTITIDEPLPTSCNQGDYVKLRVNVLSDFQFDGIGQMSLGQSKIGSSLIPPNTPMQLVYTNNNNQSKHFSVLLEFMY